MASKEQLIVMKTPFAEGQVMIPNIGIPSNSVFEVANPFITSGSLALKPEKQTAPVGDDDFDVKVVSFEEKAQVVSNLTTKKERILEGSGKVISFFKEAADYKLKHLDDFRTLAEQAAIMARLSAAACAPGDGHGIQSISTSLSTNGEVSLSSNVTSIFSKGGHKEGKHDHCSGCGGDLTEGKCSKCAA